STFSPPPLSTPLPYTTLFRSGYFHGLRELARRALELPQTAPEEQTDFHRILEGRGCWHLFGAPFKRHMKWPTECNAVWAHRGPRSEERRVGKESEYRATAWS